MSKVIYRKTDVELEEIETGYGCWLRTKSGRSLYDLSSSAMFACYGHSCEPIVRGMKNQLDTLPNAFGGYWATAAAERAAEHIYDPIEAANPGWFGGVIFQNGGSETVDLACRLATQYHLEGGEHRVNVMARHHAFHGMTLMSASLSGHYPRYEMMETYTMYVQQDYVMRVPHTLTCTEDSAISFMRYLMEEFKISAVLIEPVGGPPTCAHVEQVGYMQALRDLCDTYGVLLIFDEIMVGAGRCGYMTTAEYYGVWPDITLLGKGLTGGYFPMSAMVLSRKVKNRIRDGSGQVMFGTTFSHHTTGCAAVAAAQGHAVRERLFAKVRTDGKELYDLVSETVGAAPAVFQVNHLGYLLGLDIRVPGTGVPYPPHLQVHDRIKRKAMEAGVVVYTKGQIVFEERDHVIIAPPFSAAWHDLDTALYKLKQVIETVTAEVENEIG